MPDERRAPGHPLRRAGAARVEVATRDRDGAHELAVGFQPGEAKRFKVDGAPVDRLVDNPARPLVSVFLPDRLELVKGPPALRRAHLDQVVAALWPSRAATRKAYSRRARPAQRAARRASARAARRASSMPAWDRELARHGIALRADRTAGGRAAARAVRRRRRRPRPGRRGRAAGAAASSARPTRRSSPTQLAEGLDADLERGFTQRGPHRDDLALLRDGRELRAYGSQGEQRMGLLALLLAEREALAAARGGAPLLLLDDVMSELDAGRREQLVDRVRAGGQARHHDDRRRPRAGRERRRTSRAIAVTDGVVLQEAAAA